MILLPFRSRRLVFRVPGEEGPSIRRGSDLTSSPRDGLWSSLIGRMEVRSEQGTVAGREPFNVAMQRSLVQAQPLLPSMRLAYAPDGKAIYKPVPTSPPPTPPYQGAVLAPPAHGLNVNLGEPVKRKRGRPRKYGPDGTMALALSPVSPATLMPPGPGGISNPAGGAENLAVLSSPDGAKKRGRPQGSGKKHQMAALGSAGIGFTPHVITVKAGEDVSSKIMSFSQHGPRAVCILSANGAISNVTLRQAATSGGTVTYEGRFEILSLSGSFLLSESGGQRSRTGGLSVSLAGPDGRVLGGVVAGLLTAASPVQVVVGSFIIDRKKEPKQPILSDPVSAPGKLGAGEAAVGAGSPPLRDTTLSGPYGGSGSPLNLSNNGNQQSSSSIPWK